MVLDRATALEWYRRNRARSDALFALIPDSAYADRPIALRNPICFYEGHIPAFGVNTLWKKALGEPGLKPEYEVLFEAGIDPDEPPGAPAASWPSRAEIREYVRSAGVTLAGAIAERPLESADNPLLRRGQAFYTVLEHEVMHQETLHYMWRRLPYAKKRSRDGAPAPVFGPDRAPDPDTVFIPAGRATLGADSDEIPFGWDNEFPKRTVAVPEFEIGIHNVTNAEFLEFVEAGGYRREELWEPEGWRWVRSGDVAHPPFWMRSERGFENNAGERGRMLSGGERQRLSIARALLKDPPILILDEATSALDAVTEAKLNAALDEVMKGRTTFVIAHRLSTIRNATRILVFDNGRVIESGTFDELVAKGGRFAELARAQFMVQETARASIHAKGTDSAALKI